MTDFLEKRPLGQTGLMVSRLGIGSSFGAPTEVIEEAVEQGINYLYWGSIRRPAFGRAMRNVARRKREEVVLTVQSYSRVPWLLAPSVDIALLRSGVDYFDILLLGQRSEPLSQSFIDAFLELREKGKVKHLAISTHNRPVLPQLFDEYQAGQNPCGIFMFRYNAAHRGAETDIFPFVPDQKPPGLIAYTATRWGNLIDANKMPRGESAASASDCYRFVLSQSAVDMVLCGPANREQMQEAIGALELGPLDPEETGRMHRIGSHVYQSYKPQFIDRGDQ
ncbi:MAG TPA: hypothetical protein QF695_00065 [Arenicellales bacterium]|jgi:aryl-alcohol dehydrogenase-like predicted oxidoreductase|nr:hypothetical protein [Nitrospinota bacterium]MDP6025069.1 hypothetical protein [Pseudomonadales bacterium]MDP7451269.1 hypothetical protein [Arenicellales bacterium]MDP7576520.1 hypothetical protein [Pseudomonadales bacterium]HJL51012.1 hypothetical protein [Arenicellales bacterium]|tara:strand:+ start:11580 stop:12416 length:837 start_codon:yes stop_codon:yes gene_type:complete